MAALPVSEEAAQRQRLRNQISGKSSLIRVSDILIFFTDLPLFNVLETKHQSGQDKREGSSP